MTARVVRLPAYEPRRPTVTHWPASLAVYDWIVVNTSAGKDSVVMLDLVAEEARAAGVLGRVIAVHADLGRVEWPGTRQLASEQAKDAGVPLAVTTRIGREAKRGSKSYRRGERYGDLLDAVRRRGRWPDAANRYCTADFKRGPCHRVLTALATRWRRRNPHLRRPCRILNCMGLRAEESPARAAREPLTRDKAASNGRREVDTLLPIHHWSEDAVWQRIRDRGLRYHPAYDLGMPRLSCVFCVFAPRAALLIAARANPELFADYVQTEREIGHTFRHRFALADLAKAVEAGEQPDHEALTGAWNM